MKKIIIAAMAMVLYNNMPTAQVPVIKKGTKLTYQVRTKDKKQYDYVVTVTAIGPLISFNWKMTDPVNTSGKITISKTALQSATSYKNYFSDGSNETLTDRSTVWLSRKNFAELKTASKTSMDMTGEYGEYKKDASSAVGYEVKGKTIHAPAIGCQFLKAGDIYYTVRVFDNPEYPLIEFMDLGDFSITLKTVE